MTSSSRPTAPPGMRPAPLQELRQFLDILIENLGPGGRGRAGPVPGPAHQQQGAALGSHRQEAVHQGPGIVEQVGALAHQGQIESAVRPGPLAGPQPER